MYDDVVTALSGGDGVSCFTWGWLVVVGDLYVVLPYDPRVDPFWTHDVAAVMRCVESLGAGRGAVKGGSNERSN